MPAQEDARVRRSRENLREALLRLLETTPLEQLTIRDVTAAADVGYTTFFRLYDSKDALLNDVAAEEIARLCDLCAPIYDAARSPAACLALCTYIDGRRALWSALLAGAAGFVREELLRQGKRIAAPRRGTNGAVPGDLSTTLAVAVMFEILAWWLKQKRPLPAARVADIIDRAAIAPVENPAPRARVKATGRRAKR